MNISDAFAAVHDFHRGTGAPIAEQPRLLPGDRLAAETLAGQLSSLKSGIDTAGGGMLVQRAAMAIEELAEWLLAHANGDLVAAADAWADRAYVLLGDAVAAGLPAAELFAEVHREQHDQGAGCRRHRQGQKGSRLQAARTGSHSEIREQRSLTGSLLMMEAGYSQRFAAVSYSQGFVGDTAENRVWTIFRRFVRQYSQMVLWEY